MEDFPHDLKELCDKREERGEKGRKEAAVRRKQKSSDLSTHFALNAGFDPQN